jgi:type I restriction enzyme R subunit
VKPILREYGYPPEPEDAAVRGVLVQAEALLSEIAGQQSISRLALYRARI